jgi:hypothetical protein
MFRVFAAILAVSLPASAASAVGSPSPAVSAITAPSINGATPSGANDKDPSLIAETEALLDRAHFSPGEIGGVDGDNSGAPSTLSRRSTGERSPLPRIQAV